MINSIERAAPFVPIYNITCGYRTFAFISNSCLPRPDYRVESAMVVGFVLPGVNLRTTSKHLARNRRVPGTCYCCTTYQSSASTSTRSVVSSTGTLKQPGMVPTKHSLKYPWYLIPGTGITGTCYRSMPGI